MIASMTKLRPFRLWLNSEKHTAVAIVGDPPIARMTNRANVVNDSFGGWKCSFFGAIQDHGTERVNLFTHGEVIPAGWADPSHGGINPNCPQNV